MNIVRGLLPPGGLLHGEAGERHFKSWECKNVIQIELLNEMRKWAALGSFRKLEDVKEIGGAFDRSIAIHGNG